MMSHKYSLILIIFLSFLGACKSRQQKEIPITPRDTTITVENAFTRLMLDSHVVAGFVADHPMSDTTRQLLINFYNSRNYQYAWFDEVGVTEHANMVWNAFQKYLEYNPDSVEVDSTLTKMLTEVFSGDSTLVKDPQTVQKTELELTQLFFTYTFSAYVGSVEPEKLQWYIPRKKVNLTELLDSLLISNKSLQDWEPVHPQYGFLRAKLYHYYDIQKKGGWPTIVLPKNKKINLGNEDSLVLTLKNRLKITDNYPVDDTSLVYSQQLRDSLREVQKTFGLTVNGNINEETIAQLNVPVKERIKQILINMERMRWVPRQPKGNWILANIPSFRLQVYNDDSVEVEMKIVVGTAATKTVIFSDQLKYIVFSPYWNVPPSIVRNEILPAMKKNPAYLQRSRMQQTGTSNGLPVIRQLPGPHNSLGLVKFLFPNNYNIYFHDTPAKSYFDRTDRAFSHGCIRLSEPFALAKYLLRNDSSWTDKKINAAMHASSEKWVPLSEPVPVFITYFTAWVDASGKLHFRKDIYGHDKRMAEHLFVKQGNGIVAAINK